MESRVTTYKDHTLISDQQQRGRVTAVSAK